MTLPLLLPGSGCLFGPFGNDLLIRSSTKQAFVTRVPTVTGFDSITYMCVCARTHTRSKEMRGILVTVVTLPFFVLNCVFQYIEFSR